MREPIDRDAFRDKLTNYLEAKMQQRGMTLTDVCRELRIGPKAKNYLFRALVRDDDVITPVGIPTPLLSVLNWLELEPRDFPPRRPRPGDLEECIRRLALDQQQEAQLLELVRGFLRNAIKAGRGDSAAPGD